MTVDDILGFRQARPILASAIAVLLVVGASFGVGYWQGTKRNQVRATQAENAANVAKGERDAFRAQAEAKDQEIAAKDAGLEAAKASLRRVEQELARSKMVRDAVVSVPLPAIPGTPMGNVGMEDGWRDLVGRQEAVILEQANVIKLQDTKISDLVISRDAWKASSEAGAREAAGLRIALEAQKSLTKNALWKGRFQGLAIGLGTGYVIRLAQR